MRQSCYKITFSRVAAPHDEIFIEIRDGMRRGAEICDVTSWGMGILRWRLRFN